MGKFESQPKSRFDSKNLRKRISKINYHDLGSTLKKNRVTSIKPSIIQVEPHMLPAKKITNSDISLRWSEAECQRYESFLKMNKGIFDKPCKKRISQVFSNMSEFISTKSPSQCRSHHQKFFRKTIEKLNIKTMKEDSISLSTRGSGVDFKRDQLIGSPMNLEFSSVNDNLENKEFFNNDVSFCWDLNETFHDNFSNHEFTFNPPDYIERTDFEFGHNEERNNLFSETFFPSFNTFAEPFDHNYSRLQEYPHCDLELLL